ncbi:3-dehydroquinate synthase [Hornefia porci]|uniref:3-dehydroquinate synthase n=1 Tax=Hornefia porci TaxID=2652292 RepID=A0A1Q9JIK8_9FIRM|nr:3-dehydroquinate synthase [Hornefia porci]OLR56049.1 3-dehydroquinate synthase [Hornefia porci]
MNRFAVTTRRPYDILIGQDILADTGSYIRECVEPCKACLVTDSKVNTIYSQVVISSLIEAGYQTSKIVFPEGEHSKNITTYTNILESLAEEGLSRSDLIIALGGGVVGDLSGFAAATYLRGIKYIQVPTTYLAAVDSSVGGKTGLNLLYGKNLAGAFWQPSMVICDYDTFRTLPEQEMLDGVAEAVKSGMIMEANLIDKVLKKDYGSVIERCVSIKKSIVEADERDTGIRQLLNFGHTVGHSIERLSSYKTSHGLAVAKGMVMESYAAYKMGLTDFDASGFLRETLSRFGFDLSIPYTAEELYKYALNDKKIHGDCIAMVIPESIGKCRLQKISLSDLGKFLRLGMEDYPG